MADSPLVREKVQEGAVFDPQSERYHYLRDGQYLCGHPVPENPPHPNNDEWLHVSMSEELQLDFCQTCIYVFANPWRRPE